MKIFRFLQDDKAGLGSIDFNKVEPMPPWVFRGELDPEAERKYGPENCWPQWSKAHWGCARNAISPQDSAAAYDYGSAITFDTEDCDVRGLIRKLSLVFKAPQFDYMWADEDIGLCCGMLGCRDGVEDYAVLPEPGSRRAYELSFDVFGSRPEEYGLAYDPKSNNYVYAGGSLARSAALKTEPPDWGDTKIWQPSPAQSAESAGMREESSNGSARHNPEAALRLEPVLNPPPSPSTIKTG